MLTLLPSDRSDAVNWLSAGFNIYGEYDLAQSTLRRRLFDPRKAPPGEDSPFGRLPAYMAYRPVKTTDFFQASGDDRDSFQGKFAARASVDTSVGAFSGHIEAAFGQQVAESSQYSYANMSFRSQLGNLVLEGLAKSEYLSDDFLAALKALPDQARAENLAQFSDFFQTYGAYFVSQISVGATLEYYVAVRQTETMKAIQISAKMEAEYNALFVSGKASAEMSSDQEWKSYRQSKKASIIIKGGGDVERDVLAKVDSKSLDSMSPTTVERYDKWLQTVSSNAAVMDFRLTGVWEVCGAKRKVVEDAFREYGHMMRPLLHVETSTVVAAGTGYTPGVFLAGSLIPADAVLDKGWGGYRMVVIDRRNPSAAGVRLSKLYSVPSGDGSQYGKVFDAMAADLTNGGFIDDRYFLVLAAFGTLNAFPPVPAFVRQMQQAGAGTQLDNWIASAAGGIGTGHITGDVNYILVGIMKSGPGAGVELFRLFPMTPPRVAHVSSLNVYFYALGGGRPYVLGSAELKP